MKKGFLFKSMRVIVVLSLATAVAVILIKMRPKPERQVPTKSRLLVEVFPAKAENLNMMIETYGTVKPREVLKLVTEVRGQVVYIHPSFKEGSFIKKGTTLIKIDPRTYQLEVERRKVQIRQAEIELKRLKQEVLNLEASIKIAKSDVALAQKEFSRLKELSDKNVVAQTTLDKAEQRYLMSLERRQVVENKIALTGPLKEQLQAQLDMAKVMFRQAKLDLGRTRIVTSFNGWVLEKGVENGQHVNAGQYLGRIYRDGVFDIIASISTKDLKWLPPVIKQSSLPEANIIFGSKDNIRAWKGRIARIKAQMDEKTRTLPVVIEVNEPIAGSKKQDIFRLRPGMFVTIQIKGKEINKAFVLPRHMVHDGDTVYIVNDSRLRIKPVKILRRFKDSMFVGNGLIDGDLIIKTPISGAIDGMEVRVRAED
jgi:multidrug efflux pump subunit AcrA (membrane-fusion protein)